MQVCSYFQIMSRLVSPGLRPYIDGPLIRRLTGECGGLLIV